MQSHPFEHRVCLTPPNESLAQNQGLGQSQPEMGAFAACLILYIFLGVILIPGVDGSFGGCPFFEVGTPFLGHLWTGIRKENTVEFPETRRSYFDMALGTVDGCEIRFSHHGRKPWLQTITFIGIYIGASSETRVSERWCEVDFRNHPLGMALVAWWFCWAGCVGLRGVFSCSHLWSHIHQAAAFLLAGAIGNARDRVSGMKRCWGIP